MLIKAVALLAITAFNAGLVTRLNTFSLIICIENFKKWDSLEKVITSHYSTRTNPSVMPVNDHGGDNFFFLASHHATKMTLVLVKITIRNSHAIDDDVILTVDELFFASSLRKEWIYVPKICRLLFWEPLMTLVVSISSS